MSSRVDIDKLYKTLISIIEDREKIKIQYSLHKKENIKERGNDSNEIRIQNTLCTRD